MLIKIKFKYKLPEDPRWKEQGVPPFWQLKTSKPRIGVVRATHLPIDY